MSQELEIYFGRVGKDPEVRQTKSNETLCLFSIACQPTNDEKTIWKNIVAWGDLAKVTSLCLRKGSKVFVQGSSKKSEYTDKNGRPRIYEELKARHVGFVNC